MKPKLTDEQRKAVQKHNGDPILIEDAKSNRTYVLILADEYEVRSGTTPTLDITDTYSLQDQVAHAEGWDDPAMDDYNDYGRHLRNV